MVAVVEVKNLNSDFKKQERAKYSNPLMQANEYRFKIGCKWIILTDFKRIRLYHNNANKYEEFVISNDLINHKEKLINFFFFLHKDRLMSENNPSPINSLLEFQKQKYNELNNLRPIHKKNNNTILATYKSDDKNVDMNIVDEIYQSIIKFKGLKFINPELISNIFPFNREKEEVYHYDISSYAIQSIDKEVYNLFSSIKIDNGNITVSEEYDSNDCIEKITEIVKKLNDSLIFRFQGYENIEIVNNYLTRPNVIAPSLKYRLGNYENQLKTFNINLLDNKKNDSEEITELHLSLQFDKLLNKIKTSEGKDDFFSFEIAYACSLLAIDDYKKSFIIYRTLFEKNNLQTDEHQINIFLSKFNLKHLFNLISSHYWLDDRTEILEEIRQIDLDKTFENLNLEDSDIREAIREIKENKLFTRSVGKINDNSQNIQKAYELYENGGTQHGPYYPGLQWNEFVLTYTNFTSNYILYEVFSEFNNYYQTIFNSLIISHATDDSYNEKLKIFEYYQIICAFLYTSPDQTNKSLNKIKLNELKISEENKQKTVSVILNYLGCNHEHGKKAMFGDVYEKRGFTSFLASSYTFRDRYYTIFENIFLLISKIDFNENNIQAILKSLIKFITVDKHLGWTSYKYLAKWINNLTKKDTLDYLPKLLETIIENIIENKIRSIDSSIFHAISNNLIQKNINESPKPTIISKALLFFTESGHCSYSDVEILVSLWSVSSKNNQNEIKTKLLKLLSDRFEPIIYTKLVYGSIIPFDTDDLFEKYIKSYSNYIAPQIEIRRNKMLLRDYSFNYFVEFIYSQNIKLKKEQLKEFTKLEGYYYWLLNYENFSYENFNPEWLLFWRTDTYLKRFSKVKEIRFSVKEYLKKNYNENLSKIYFKYLVI